jgi:hypothetical protein
MSAVRYPIITALPSCRASMPKVRIQFSDHMQLCKLLIRGCMQFKITPGIILPTSRSVALTPLWKFLNAVHSNRVAHSCLRSDRLDRCLTLQVRPCLTTILLHYTMAINMCLQSRHAWSFMSDGDVAPKLEKLGLILELSSTYSDLQSLQV